MIGKTVSHYRITRELGTGGMGVVYEAVDLKLDRTVALKFLPPESTRDAEAKARFVHEAKAASALDHPNVCTVYEIDETAEGQIFLAMACYEGETLKERIARGPLPLQEALDISRQVAQGLGKAHEGDIVHRDIKPANIFLTTDGLVKILDFGLAKLAGQTLLTKTGTTLGTAGYMSPEQARGDTSDLRADLWCLGVVLYEMVTGRLPFEGDHEQAIVYAILNQEAEPVTALRTGVPMEMERIIGKCLAKVPEQRYQHANDLIVDLKALESRLAAGDDAGSHSLAPKTSAGRKASGAKRRWASLGVVVLIAAVVVVGWVLSDRAGDPGTRIATSGNEANIRSLAVLPFDNMMDDPAQDYFVDGMHEALITSLSKLGSLRVISRTSVIRYRDTEKPMTEIARELDVDALIEGSVLRIGDEVRITAQLIDGKSDEHLWADSYDRHLRNVLSLLNEVAGAVAEEIHATLTPEQAERLGRARPVNLEAYDALLRGVQLFNTFRSGQVRESIGYFEKAIEIDPEFAEAHAWLAGAFTVSGIMGEPPQVVMPKSKASAQTALKLDDGLAVAHTAMGYVALYFDRDWEVGGAAFRRALEIDPNSAMARHGYADYLVALGKLDESVDQVVLGRKSNPLSPMSNAVVVGHLYIARRYEETVAEAEKLLEIDPNFLAARSFLRRALWQMGRREEAFAMLAETGWGKQPKVKEALERGYADAGPEGAMLAAAQYLVAHADTARVDPLEIAVNFGRAGENEAALDWLEKAEDNYSPTIVHTLLDPCFDPIRDTARFKALRRRMNLPD
jgi:serine/threonine-protein kinase